MNDKSLQKCIDELLEMNLLNLVEDGHLLCDSCRVAKARVQIHFRSGSLNFCIHHLRTNVRSILSQVEREAVLTLEQLLPKEEFQRLVVEGGTANAI